MYTVLKYFYVFFYTYAYSGVWICVPALFTYSAATAERLQTIPPHSSFIFELQQNTEMIIWQHCGKLNAFLIWCLQTILTNSFALLSKISFEDSFYPPEQQKKKKTHRPTKMTSDIRWKRQTNKLKRSNGSVCRCQFWSLASHKAALMNINNSYWNKFVSKIWYNQTLKMAQIC